MNCPECGTENTRVVDTFKGTVERRKRRCACGIVFETTESVDKGSIRVATNPISRIGNNQSEPIPTNPGISQPLAANGGGGVGGGLSSDPIRNPDPNPDVSDLPIRAREPNALPPFRAPYRPAVLGAATPAFLRVYDRYPKKIGKQPAAQVFQEIAADYPGGQEALSRAILAAFEGGMLRQHPYNGEDAKRPALERMLAERRWEDDQSVPDGAPLIERAIPGCKDWHAGGKHSNRENPRGEQPNCPECKHIRARGGYDRPVRTGEPTAVGELLTAKGRGG